MSSKKHTPAELINSIRMLLDELHSLLGGETVSIKASAGKSQKKYSGVAGGIKMLINDRFFKEPKMLSEVIDRLRQEGFNYRRPVIAMALLRAVRNRFLVRLEAYNPESKEKWAYAERK